MFFLPEVHRHPAFREGMRDMAPVAPGLSLWGMMTGVAMVRAGMTPFEAMAMTVLVYAGSAQLAAIPLIVAGAPAWIIWATAFCVNLRFVVFSLHLRDYLIHLPRWRRITNGFLTADMTYAMFTRRFPAPPRDAPEGGEQEAYLAGNYFTTWTGWVGASFVGILVGNVIPPDWGLGFAGVLCLVGVLCSLANTRLRALAAVVAGGVAVAAYAIPLKLNVVVAIAAAVGLCFWLDTFLPDEEEARA